MSTKTLFKILSGVAFALLLMVFPFRAYAQDVICTITGVNVYIDHAELRLANCSATETAKLVKEFQAELGSTATSDEPATVADEPQGGTTNSGWSLHEYPRLSENPIVESWIERLREPAPELWQTYPNVPNPLVPGFRVVDETQVPWGVEYGVANVPFCQQDQRCDFIVPAWHYRLITADYKFEDFECKNTADDPKGCLLLLINVMDQSYTWRNQMADNGFTVAGRYWDGDNLEWGVWGLVSHASANMLNMPTMAAADEALNFSDGANAGANCGTPNGCNKVEARVVIHAGDEILGVLETTITRPQSTTK